MNAVDLLSGANAAIVALVLMLTGAMTMVFDKQFASGLGQRLLPVVPLVLGVVLALAGVASDGATLQEKLVSGLVSGMAAAISFKLGHTTVMGTGVTASK